MSWEWVSSYLLGSLPEEEGGVLSCSQHFQNKSRGKQGLCETSTNCSKLRVRSWNSDYSLYQRNNPLVLKLFPMSKLRRLSQESGGRDSGWWGLLVYFSPENRRLKKKNQKKKKKLFAAMWVLYWACNESALVGEGTLKLKYLHESDSWALGEWPVRYKQFKLWSSAVPGCFPLKKKDLGDWSW